MDFTRALRELLRLTGPVENVHQENPARQLINFVGNTNMPLIRPPAEYNNIKVILFYIFFKCIKVYCNKIVDIFHRSGRK